MVTTRSKTKSLPPARVQLPRDESEEPEDDDFELETRAPKRIRTRVKKEEQDILPTINIASHAHPGDLISLSRTSKQWRELLMRRSAEKIWLFAESNVPQLPAYPWSNMSPVRYATLLFTKHCTACGEITTISADPYLMVRLCVECRETELVELVGREHFWRGPEKLVCFTNMMTFRKKNAAKRTRGSGSLKYCLRKELEEVRATHRELSQPGCEVALARWKIEAKDELDLRKEFAATLKSFLRRVDITRYEELESVKKERSNEINKRLLALGYTESELKIHYSLSSKWRALVEQPRVLSDRVWENLLPKLTPILESNKAQAEEDAKSARKTKRQAELHKLLREFKLETHPLADMVRELGHEPKLPEPTASNGSTLSTTTTSGRVARFLNSYPFPDTHTALGWSFFKEITANDMSLEEVKALFDAHREEVEEKAGAWRTKIECGLTQKVLMDESLPPLNDMVEVNGSTDSTISLCSLPRLLLRADTIFSRRKDAAYDEQLLHYPLFLPTKDQFWSHDWPLNIIVSQYVFHSKASAVARALLKDLGKPDASGLEMSIAGKVFRCGRCVDFRPVNWDGILKHYLYEHQTSALISSSAPRFKTRHPITFEDTHSLEDDSLVHQVTKGGSAPVPCDLVYCLPCKNYGRMFVGVEQGQMDRHLQSVHHVVSGVQDIHWGLVSDSGTFLQNGGAWKERWDEYYDEREKTHEQGLDTDKDEPSDAD